MTRRDNSESAQRPGMLRDLSSRSTLDMRDAIPLWKQYISADASDSANPATGSEPNFARIVFDRSKSCDFSDQDLEYLVATALNGSSATHRGICLIAIARLRNSQLEACMREHLTLVLKTRYFIAAENLGLAVEMWLEQLEFHLQDVWFVQFGEDWRSIEAC